MNSFFNRERPCPNIQTIRAENDSMLTVHHIVDIPYKEITGRYKSEVGQQLRDEDEKYVQSQVNKQIDKAAKIACRSCVSLAVDTAEGFMFCGRKDIPENVSDVVRPRSI